MSTQRTESVFGDSRTELDSRIEVVEGTLRRDERVMEPLLHELMRLNAGVKQLAWPDKQEAAPGLQQQVRYEVQVLLRRLGGVQNDLQPFSSTSLSDGIDFLKLRSNEYLPQIERTKRAA